MSGSYDRPPPGRRAYPAPAPAEAYEFDDPVTGPATGQPQPQPQPQSQPQGQPMPGGRPAHAQAPAAAAEETTARRETTYRPQGLEAGRREDMYAPARNGDADHEPKKAPIVPAGSVTGRSLTLVVSIMCFLACLTSGAVYLIKQSADAWLRDIASEVTVQVEPKDRIDTEKTLKDVSEFLEKQAGIADANILSLDESTALLEPWLGSSDALKTLPVPRLIAIDLDRTSPPDLDAVRGQLTKQFPGVSLDDHRQWQQQIRTVTRSFALGGVAILLLVAAATTAIIVSATKSAMASNREIVEVLHFVGATDRFIAREFEKHFLRLGVRAGLVGALSAMLVFLVMPTVMDLLGGGGVTAVELQRLIGTGALDIAGYLLLGLIVIVVAALCMLTSRLGVFRILNARH